MLREYAKYTSLNVLGMLGLSCYILADTYFVAKGLGSSGLAALNLAIPVYSFIHGTGLMLGMGGATWFSIFKSQGAKERNDQVFSHTAILACCFAVLFVVAGLTVSRGLTALLGADRMVFEMTQTYLRVLLLFSPAFLANDLLLCFVRNDGAPQLAMAAMLGGSFSNIILDYVFIFLFQMGIFGAVFATGLAPIISLIILSPFFWRHKNSFHLQRSTVGERFRLQRHMAAQILTGGIPSLVAEVSSGIVIIVFNVIIFSLQGNIGVAAYGVVANLSLVAVAVFTGIAQGIQPIVSKYYGLGEVKKRQTIFRYAVFTVIVLSGLIYLGMFVGAGQVAAIFNSEGNQELQRIAVDGIRIYFTGVVFAGFNIVAAIYFTSTDQAKPANLISMLRGFVLIVPLAFLMSWLFGITGLWLTFPLTEFLVAIIGTEKLKNQFQCN